MTVLHPCPGVLPRWTHVVSCFSHPWSLKSMLRGCKKTSGGCRKQPASGGYVLGHSLQIGLSCSSQETVFSHFKASKLLQMAFSEYATPHKSVLNTFYTTPKLPKNMKYLTWNTLITTARPQEDVEILGLFSPVFCGKMASCRQNTCDLGTTGTFFEKPHTSAFNYIGGHGFSRL